MPQQEDVVRIMKYLSYPITLALAINLLACGNNDNAVNSGHSITADFSTLKSQALIPLNNHYISSSESSGVTLLDQDQNLLDQVNGTFEYLDHRTVGNKHWFISVDKNTNQTILWNPSESTLGPGIKQTVPNFNIDGLCLYAEGDKLYSFFLDGNGLAQQWLLSTEAQHSAQLVREFPVAPGGFCSVDDRNHHLYTSEESVGIWQYDARAESKAERHLMAAVSPWGKQLGTDVAGLAAFDGGVFSVSPSSKKVVGWTVSDKGSGTAFAQYPLSSVGNVEFLSLQNQQEKINLISIDEHSQLEVFDTSDQAQHQDSSSPDTDALVPVLRAKVETSVMPRLGDVADDPAIWHNHQKPEQSRILGTNKTSGLHVYDMQGKQTQFLPVGRLNNVDLRQQITVADKTIDLAAASLRDDNSVALFSIQPDSGVVKHLMNFDTGMDSIYGLCMYQSREGDKKNTYVFVNDKSGLYHQYLVHTDPGPLQHQLVRTFSVGSQPEGCVADDSNHQLFVGEEDAAVWQFSAAQDASNKATLVSKVGTALKDDVEGMAIYHGQQQSYLIVSSQGDNSYAVFETKPPFRYRGSFRIGLNTEQGIDGSSETDGLDVSSLNFGGPFSEGMLVVQDGFNVLPSQAQNFKYIDWAQIRNSLDLH